MIQYRLTFSQVSKMKDDFLLKRMVLKFKLYYVGKLI